MNSTQVILPLYLIHIKGYDHFKKRDQISYSKIQIFKITSEWEELEKTHKKSKKNDAPFGSYFENLEKNKIEYRDKITCVKFKMSCSFFLFFIFSTLINSQNIVSSPKYVKIKKI